MPIAITQTSATSVQTSLCTAALTSRPIPAPWTLILRREHASARRPDSQPAETHAGRGPDSPMVADCAATHHQAAASGEAGRQPTSSAAGPPPVPMLPAAHGHPRGSPRPVTLAAVPRAEVTAPLAPSQARRRSSSAASGRSTRLAGQAARSQAAEVDASLPPNPGTWARKEPPLSPV